jgi:hypothetical protein
MPFGITFGGGQNPFQQVQDFGQNVRGLLSSPKQQAGLSANPMFQAGMGLLGSSYDASVNPFQAAMQGLQKGTTEQQTQEDRERLEKARKQLAAYFAAQGEQVPGQAPPTMQEQALQQSLAPGQPGASMPGGAAPPIPQRGYTPAYASLPGGDELQRQQRRMAWEQIIGR